MAMESKLDATEPIQSIKRDPEGKEPSVTYPNQSKDKILVFIAPIALPQAVQ